MTIRHTLPTLLATLCLAVALCACHDDRPESASCSFYDIPEMPAGWKVSMPPGINNDDNRSLANYYNNEENASVTINIASSDGKPLDALTADVLENLRSQGSRNISEPVRDGALSRIEGSFTGQEMGVIWIGVNDDVMALTVATGNMESCARLLGAIRNVAPDLLPTGGSR